jgi:hypothetical protein
LVPEVIVVNYSARTISALTFFFAAQFVTAAEYSLPERVQVLPVAFIPTDQQPPTNEQRSLFLRHLDWAQRRYREMLNGDTFELAKAEVDVVRGTHPLDYYRQTRERGAPDIVTELLTHYQVSRFRCP